jgi:hypothetical protein
MIVNITDVECRELVLLLIQSPRKRFIVSYGTPSLAGSIAYQLPYGLTDLLDPADGATIRLTVQAYDVNSVQIASSFTITTWNVPYSGVLVDAFLPNKGVFSNAGGASLIDVNRAVWALENDQPLY